MTEPASPSVQILATRLNDRAGALYAVVDGGRIADLPVVLDRHGLPSHQLFLGNVLTPKVAAGPFLIPLDPARLESLLRIAGIQRAATFWNGSADDGTVVRHLRGLNQARVPKAGPDGRYADANGTEIVIFRHWDPSVLEILWPLLHPAQRSRLFGPMRQVTIQSQDLGDVVQALADPAWPAQPHGPIQLDAEQMEQLAAAMEARSQRAIAAYLRRNAAQHTQGMDDAALLRFVRSTQGQARDWGVRTEAGFGRFAWLTLATGGVFGQMEEARKYVTGGRGTADKRLKNLMRVMSARLSRGV